MKNCMVYALKNILLLVVCGRFEAQKEGVINMSAAVWTLLC